MTWWLYCTLYQTNRRQCDPPIIHIINCSNVCGTVPDELKMAKIVPIHKSGDFINCRPILLIGIIANILEKIIKNQLLEYLESDKIIFERQYGFRRNVGTEEVLINLINFCITKGIVKRKL